MRYRLAGKNLNGVSQPIISYRASKLKPMIKAHSSGRMVSSGISDVVIASVHSEKTRLKKLMMIMIMIIIIITQKQRTSKREKGDVGMAKHFFKKYRNKG